MARSVVSRWSVTQEVNLGPDGDFFYLMNDGSMVTAGTFSVDNDELTWETDSFCAGEEGAEQATYAWVLDRNTLRLTPKGDDGCEERALKCSGGFRLFMRDMDFDYEATFGEEFSLGDGIWVTVNEPVAFTPSEEVSTMSFWRPLALEEGTSSCARPSRGATSPVGWPKRSGSAKRMVR